MEIGKLYELTAVRTDKFVPDDFVFYLDWDLHPHAFQGDAMDWPKLELSIGDVIFFLGRKEGSSSHNKGCYFLNILFGDKVWVSNCSTNSTDKYFEFKGPMRD